MQQLTLLTALLISSSMALTSCVSADIASEPEEAQVKKTSKQRIYFASYDAVWRAVHTVLKYTIASENPDTGLIETEYIKGVEGWLSPEQKKAPSAGLRYKLVFILAKGKTDGRDSTRVTIEKKIEVLRDFFSEPQNLESDGYEETVLFYRIEREILINEALKKVEP